MTTFLCEHDTATAGTFGGRSNETSEISTDDGRERKDPVVFGLIEMPKARIGKMNKLFHSVFDTEVRVRSIASAKASATGIRKIFGIRIGMR